MPPFAEQAEKGLVRPAMFDVIHILHSQAMTSSDFQ
jgi:hypothetical protein